MAKGLPKPGAITCIQCPKGCRVTVSPDGTTKGNGCPKGAEYALQEMKAPKRVLTTTLLAPDGSLVPVKTSRPIPKDQVMVWAENLRTTPASAGPIRPGQILLRDPFGIKVDILAADKH
jgi:CxxC motif-containing protein